MATPEAERQMWLDYVGKLNDRALQRQRASGFTTWAILGVIALLATHIIGRLNVLTTSGEAWAIHILATTGTLNLTFFGMLTFGFRHYLDQLSPEIRLRSKLDRFSVLYFWAPLVLALLFMAVLNLLSAKYAASHGLDAMPFWLLGVLLGLFGIIVVYKGIRSYRKKSKQGEGLPELAYVPMRDSIRTPLTRLIFVFFIIPLVPVAEAIPRITKQSHVDALIWSLAVATSFCLTCFLLIRSIGTSHDLFFRALREENNIAWPLCRRNSFGIRQRIPW